MQVMARTAPAEEQLDMALRKLDACHRSALILVVSQNKVTPPTIDPQIL